MAQQTTESLQCQGNRQPNPTSIKFWWTKLEPKSAEIKNENGKGHIPGWEKKREAQNGFAWRGWRVVVGCNDKRRGTLEYSTLKERERLA